MRGKFLTIEGTEGVGKSTNISFIKEYLGENGVDLRLTREPGGTPLAEDVRELLLVKREENVDPMAELLLIFAARAQHLNSVILPALDGGQWVLSDRFTDATYAYQGYGRGLNLQQIAMLEQLVQSDVRPDKTLWLDIDVQLGLQRASERGELDRFESETLTFFERVRSGYEARMAGQSERFARIDASLPLSHVQGQIKAVLDTLLVF